MPVEVVVPHTTQALDDVRSLGYRRMRLEPYYELADDLRGWLVFMELELA